MRTLNVNLDKGRSYPIHSGKGLLGRADLIYPHLPAKQVVVISNDIVAPRYLETLTEPLREYGIKIQTIILPDGETAKHWESVNTIIEHLLTWRCDRTTSLIALGGGVIGDITGFAAAIYQRGIPYIQAPTTLLAQVDSSVGGKTGINHPHGKNMIGAFWQPQLVLADTCVLNTLPKREFSAGLAEVIKYGLIHDLDFLAWIEAHIDALMRRESDALAYAIYRSCQNKAHVVMQDEREKATHNGRVLLNLGHTFAHAIEAGMGYGVWLHGEAVSVGMLMAAELSRRLGWLQEADCERVRNLCQCAGLPSLGPPLGVERYLEYMGRDKKNLDGNLRLVLLKKLGEAVTTQDVPLAEIRATIETCSIFAANDA